MEHRLVATVDGEVVEVFGAEGQQLSAGAVVLRIDAAPG
jgi:biotin carboxyl carrier protein